MSATGTSRRKLRRGDGPILHAVRLQLMHSVVVLAMTAMSQAAWAQRWTIEPSVSSQVVWANNTLIGEGPSQSDLVLELRPSVAIRGEGSRLKVAGAAALDSAVFANGTRPNRALPQGNLNARLEAVERWLYLEAGARAAQASTDPFGVRAATGATASMLTNTLTTTQVRLTPSIEASLDPATRYAIRSENSWTRETVSGSGTTNVGTNGGGYFGRHSASIERDPVPIGGRLEVQRDRTRYRAGVTAPLVSNSARLSLNLAVMPEVSMGLRVGYQRDNFLTSADNGIVYGAQAKWLPSARTQLSGEAEKRQYGSTWQLGFNHRMPRLAFALSLSRAAQTTPQAVFELPATGNVALLLDSILIRSIADPVDRARAVQRLMAEQGLPDSTASPTIINSQRLSLVTSGGGSVALTGVRNTLVFSGFYVKTADLPGSTLLATGSAANNNRQQGLGLTISHRLSPADSVSGGVDWSRIRSTGVLVEAATSERGLRVQYDRQITAKTSALAGLRYRSLSSNVVFSGHDFSLFAGASHRF